MANITQARKNANEMSTKRKESARAMPTSYFGMLSSFFQDMDRIFDDSMRHFGLPVNNLIRGFRPNMDVTSSPHEYVITCEMPGMDEDDMQIKISPEGTLTISGEKRQEHREDDKDSYRAECSYGTFERQLTLPDDVDADNIEASFHNGVLTITCPRMESERESHRRIPVNGSRRNGARSEGSQTGSHERSAKNENARKTA